MQAQTEQVSDLQPHQERVRRLVDRVTFRNWDFRVGLLAESEVFIQVEFTAPCTVTGNIELQRGRKYFISRHAIDDEILKTCWVAIDAALRHEAMEEFKIDGVAPFHPHTNIEALVELQTRFGTHVHRDPEGGV